MADSTALVVISNRNGGPIPRTAPQVRARLLRSFDERVGIAEAIADGDLLSDRVTRDGDVVQVGPEIRDRLKALDLLARYAGLQQPEMGGASLTVNVIGGVSLGSPESPPNGLGSLESHDPAPVDRSYVGHPGSIIVPAVRVEGLGQGE